MYEDTMTAPEGPSRNQALMRGLLLLRARMQQALNRMLAGGRSVAGVAGRLIAGVGNLGAVNVARALLATPLYWARNAVAKARPLLDVAAARCSWARSCSTPPRGDGRFGESVVD